MTPQRRTALVSVVAAFVLIALKLVTGIATHSLGLLSEAAHSGTDLVAALLTFVAVGVAARPADPGHAYGHGKAEHLAALAEAGILVFASLLIVWRAVSHLVGATRATVDPAWYALVVLAVVIFVDLSRTVVSFRAARRYRSSALQANAFHFASDLAGSTAVLIGLVGVRAGWREADSAAALFVAALVFGAAARLMRRNVDVLMDRVLAAAQRVPQVREIHNLSVLTVDGRAEISLHLKLPGDLSLEEAHAVATEVEQAIVDTVPEIEAVQTHPEPLAEAGARRGRPAPDVGRYADAVMRIVRRTTGAAPRELRFLDTDDGLVAYLTLGLDPTTSLADAHARASEIEERIRRERPDIADV